MPACDRNYKCAAFKDTFGRLQRWLKTLTGESYLTDCAFKVKHLGSLKEQN